VESIENPCIENPQAPELNPWGRLQNLKSKISNRMTGGDAPYLRPDWGRSEAEGIDRTSYKSPS
jgi:hypothetical protein